MIKIEETKVTVITEKDCTDTIIIQFDGPNPFPLSDMHNYKPQFFLEVQQGLGIEYCRNVFNVEPEIIDRDIEYRIDHD